MNALLHALSSLEPKIEAEHDGFEDIHGMLEKWSVRCYYLITQEGVPNSRMNMGPDADGVPAEIMIVKCSLVQRETDEELDRPLSDFTADELSGFRDEIENRING